MPDDPRTLKIHMVVVFGVAALLRLGLALNLPADDSVFWDEPCLEYAQNFAEGRGFWMSNPYGPDFGIERAYAFRPPLFPFLWGCVYKLTGGAYGPIRVFHALLGSAACVLAYLAGLELARKRGIALVGGLLCAVYPPLIWHSVHLMTEPLFIFLQTSCLLALFRMRHGHAFRWGVIAGSAAGLAALTRSVLIGFIPFVAVWIWWALGRRPRAVLAAFVFCAAAAAVISPWVARNVVVLRAFVPSTTDVGHGFYVANNPRSLENPGGFWTPDDWSFIKEPGEASVGEVQASRRLVQRARKYLFEHPGAAVRLIARRFVNLWRFYPHLGEPVRVAHVAAYAVSYAPLLPFMLVGLVLAHRRGGEGLGAIVLVDLLILYTTAAHAAVLAMMRYRVPLMPFLLVFAALALCGLWGRLTGQAKRRPAEGP